MADVLRDQIVAGRKELRWTEALFEQYPFVGTHAFATLALAIFSARTGLEGAWAFALEVAPAAGLAVYGVSRKVGVAVPAPYSGPRWPFFVGHATNSPTSRDILNMLADLGSLT